MHVASDSQLSDIERGPKRPVRRQNRPPDTSAPQREWSSAPDDVTQPLFEAVERAPAKPAQEPSEPPRSAPLPAAPPAPTPSANRPAALVEPVPEDEATEAPSLASASHAVCLETGPVPDGIRDGELSPSVRLQPHRSRTVASHASAFVGGALATFVAIQFVGVDREPTVAAFASVPVAARAAVPDPGAVAPPAHALQPITPTAPVDTTAIGGHPIVTEAVLRKGEWLAASFRRHDIPMPILTLIVGEVGDVFDFTRSQPGHRYSVTRDGSGELVSFRYVIGSRGELRVRRMGEGYTVTLDTASTLAR